jgi:hypothetical protein
MTEFATNTVAPTTVPAEAEPILRHDSEVRVLRQNGDVDWERFDPDAYSEINYRLMRNDDQSVIEIVGDFFSRHFRELPRMHSLRALDVGSAGNLYPALGMLPWSDTITLTDISAAGVGWLIRAAGAGAQAEPGRWAWQPFWAEYARYLGYQQLIDPRDLRRLEPANWDLGTMFFVAESITSDVAEFAQAVGAFLHALVPGAPFAVALMDRSVGYVVAGQAFPAVTSVDLAAARAEFARYSDDAVVTTIDVPADDPALDGYACTIVAVGTVRAR